MDKMKIKRNPNKSKPEFKNPNKYAFIVGNGTSRADFDLAPLMDYGMLVGCNYFYRDMHPHVLVLSDEGITKTVAKVDKVWCKRNHVFSWYSKPGGTIKKVSFPEKTSAGLMAVYESIETFGAKNIFLVGMDFFGLGSNGKDDNGKINNLYVGEKHYAQDPEQIAPTYRNWQRRFQYVLRKYPDVNFYHVAPLDGKSPERLLGAPNWHQISWDNLQDHLNNDVGLIDLYDKTPEDEALFLEENPDDVRATIERQFSGQENVLFPDKIHPDDMLNLRMQLQQEYIRSGQLDGILAVKIKDFEITVPPLYVSTPKGVGLMPLEMIPQWYKSECHKRYTLEGTRLEPFKKLGRPKQAMATPPPPPPPGMGDLPPPPPPPPPPPVL